MEKLLKIQSFAEWEDELKAKNPPRFLIQNFLRAGAVIQITGEPKVGRKTFFAMVCGTAIASGKTLSSLQPVSQEAVLILEHEDTEYEFHSRFKSLENSYGVDFRSIPFYVMFRQPFSLEDERSLAEVQEFMIEKNVKLVIVDTFVKSTDANENDAREMTRALKQLDKLRVNGSAVMYLHHMNRPPQYSPKYGPQERDIDHEVRGSSAVAGNYDQHFAFRVWPTQQETDEDGHRVTVKDPSLHLIVRGKSEPDTDYRVEWAITNTSAKMEIKRL